MENRDLQFGLFFLSARPWVRTFSMMALIAVASLAFLSFAQQGLAFLLAQQRVESYITELSKETVAYSTLHNKLLPPPLAQSSPSIVRTDGANDQVIFAVQNPSRQWALASASYTIVMSGSTLGEGTFSLLPGEKRYLIAASAASVAAQSVPVLSVAAPTWQRIRNPDAYTKPLVSIGQGTYHILSTIPGKLLSQATGTLSNDTAEIIPDITVTALLKNGPTIIAASQVIMHDIQPFENKTIDLRFFSAPQAASVELVASLDALRLGLIQE